MKPSASKPAYRKQRWPTSGSKVARAIRREMSELSDAEREEYFRNGIVLTYGGILKETRARHEPSA